jgi:hypothetical protein
MQRDIDNATGAGSGYIYSIHFMAEVNEEQHYYDDSFLQQMALVSVESPNWNGPKNRSAAAQIL